MIGKQHIFRERREYNQWVNNQTLEDYSLRFTALAARKWSIFKVANTALGSISFLALEAIGAVLTITYGFDIAVAAILSMSVLIFFIGLPICYYAARYGVDIDLLTRGAGFGYIGSTITSLIYATFTFIFFALESAIMAKALNMVFGMPLMLAYLTCSVAVIPIVFYGITVINKFQLWTQPVWLFLQIFPFIFIFYQQPELIDLWTSYIGLEQELSATGEKQFNIIHFGIAASVILALVAQIGEQVDFLRFMPEKTKENSTRWWIALLIAGPGWVIPGGLKLLAGSLLAVVALSFGTSYADASDPTSMYTVAFSFFTKNSQAALILAGIFVVVCQLKINVTNAYAGSIAWSNFFSRLTHNHPGRVVWLIFNVIIAYVIMQLGIYQTFEKVLSAYAIVAVSWFATLVSDLLINKTFGLSPKHIEFRRAYLYDINPVGFLSMVLGTCIGFITYFGGFGTTLSSLAHFIALVSSFLLVPFIAIITKGKYYIARELDVIDFPNNMVQCCICLNKYEKNDIALCPAYDGFICSLCCSLDTRCHDACKPDQKAFFELFVSQINSRLLRFVFVQVIVTAIAGVLLALIYNISLTGDVPTDQLLGAMLWKVFFLLLIVSGVLAWLFILANESHVSVEKEMRKQTLRLFEEIEAHKKTDKELQAAKEYADAANSAKSRYLAGLSHELRTPLNTILGYVQLIQMEHERNSKTGEQLSVVLRSCEHLTDLIEGLLDISKIEAGKLEIQQRPIKLNQFVHQLAEIYSAQAEEKGLEFRFHCETPLPEYAMGDEKRLRQIFINLLSNAIKFTEKGHVALTASYHFQVAEFTIEDTGVGINENDYERIFRPFERVRQFDKKQPAGTGLGLTITRLLADIMGGDIFLKKNQYGGTTFTCKLMLSSLEEHGLDEIITQQIYGYEGKKKTVLVVDDEALHRGLIYELLSPLEFIVVEAPDPETCLKMVESFSPDIFLIDRLMPGIDGTELANLLRRKGFSCPIIMVSGTANEDISIVNKEKGYDDYLMKPIKLAELLQCLSVYLNLNWKYAPNEEEAKPKLLKQDISPEQLPDESIRQEILHYSEIGHLNELKNIFERLKLDKTSDQYFLDYFESCLKELKFRNIARLVTVTNE